MSIYQRFLSKSLIFFSVLFIIFLFFIESSIGFKWFFYFTNRFFIGLKTEEVSGNWRDFILKNVQYKIYGLSITANSLHVILDTTSLFKISTIFKDIDAKNLIISLNHEISSDFLKKNTSSNFFKNNLFIRHPIIFKKIHVDKISFKSSKTNIFFFNLLSGIKLINNHIILLPTYVDAINYSSLIVNFTKKNFSEQSNFLKKFNNTKKKYTFLKLFTNKIKKFFPLNINLIHFQCNRIKFKNYKNNNVFQIELKAKIENSIVRVKKIKINSSFLKIYSYGKFFLNNDDSISCLMKNTVVIPRFYNRIINFSFKANLNTYSKLKFHFKCKNFYKIKIDGSVLLSSLDYPFLIKLKSKNLFFFIKKDRILKLDSLNGVLRGKTNNYFISLQNTLTLQGFPSVFFKIQGEGNLKNIFLKKIKLFPIKQKKIFKETIPKENNIKYHPYILALIGKMNVENKNNNNIHILSIPKIHIDGNIMKKKFSILGSLHYKNFNFIKIPGISLFLGDNKLYLKAFLGETYNINSSFYANNLNYFSPNLKGKIKAKVNFRNNCKFSTINSKIFASGINWNHTYVKKFKMLTQINTRNLFLGKILIDVKKIFFPNFYINALNIQTQINHDKQKISFLLKSPILSINFIVNGIFNKKTGNWHGFFKKINIKTVWGKITAKRKNVMDYYDNNNIISNVYQKSLKKRDVFLSFLKNTKISFFNIFNQSIISFKSKLFVDAKLKWMLGEQISDGKIILIGHHTKLEKYIHEKVFAEKIDFFKISIDLIKNNFKSKWVVQKIRNSLKNVSIIGYLNIIDMYDKKNIEGTFTIYNFPFSFINFFTTNFNKVNGLLRGKIRIFGNFYQPKVLADFDFHNIFIKSNNILQYITLFVPYFSGKTDNIKINQEITMEKGNISFILRPSLNNMTNIEWNLIFNSKKISLLIFPQIKLKFSSELNLHYFLEKYDLIGYIKFPLFDLDINQKNFVF